MPLLVSPAPCAEHAVGAWGMSRLCHPALAWQVRRHPRFGDILMCPDHLAQRRGLTLPGLRGGGSIACHHLVARVAGVSLRNARAEFQYTALHSDSTDGKPLSRCRGPCKPSQHTPHERVVRGSCPSIIRDD
jgi:hypothetical protein